MPRNINLEISFGTHENIQLLIDVTAEFPWIPPGDGINDYVDVQPSSILSSQTVRVRKKALESARDVSAKCALADFSLDRNRQVATGLKNNGQNFTEYPVIDRQGKMQTAGSCLYATEYDVSCVWDPRNNGVLYFETSAMISAYLGQSEDSVAVDFVYYRADDSFTPRLNQDIMEEIEQMGFSSMGEGHTGPRTGNWHFLICRAKLYLPDENSPPLSASAITGKD
ncbi:L-gulonolactone oxidase-like protein [Corchorus olitorius]|uniref:L-gulonolactone oxidase-like protein n=1 Tax=Corchorus olitorius TaxID=93759 RepID=A0A1R3HDC0_9ROSI|nr:L-gulonolactone oxidase-like protein [Corchorus olitorius]